MKHQYKLSISNVNVRPLKKEDIEYLRKWRNDPSNTRFLRKIPYITKEQQEAWFLSYLDDENEIIFAIDETCEVKRIVGSASLYNFNANEVEFGRFLIGDLKAHGKKVGYNAMVAILKIAFEKLGLGKVILTCYEKNLAALKVYKALGFEEEQQKMVTKDEVELCMVLHKDKFIGLHKGE